MQMYGNFEGFPLIKVHEVWVGVLFHDPCIIRHVGVAGTKVDPDAACQAKFVCFFVEGNKGRRETKVIYLYEYA